MDVASDYVRRLIEINARSSWDAMRLKAEGLWTAAIIRSFKGVAELGDGGLPECLSVQSGEESQQSKDLRLSSAMSLSKSTPL